MFWRSINTRPIPNSMADRTKKKKVKDNKFKLSKINPAVNVNEYNVIHSNSAVKSRCKAVFELIKILTNKIKKKRINKFKSPNNIKAYIH